MAEAQIRDEYGNPIQLTDQYGNPVKLTDEHGHPVRLTGVATTATTTPPTGSGFGTYGAGATTHPTTTVADLMATEPATGTRQHYRHTDAGQLRRSSSSSSSSSEDDGQGGRRKKKGLKDKIKEKLPIGGSTQSQSQSTTNTTTTTTTAPAAATSTTAPHEQQHEKKGIMDKIREKLPGGGHHTH